MRHRCRYVGGASFLALAALGGCGSTSPSQSSSEAGTEAGVDSGIPPCTATEACVGYPSFGDWVCLESCSGPDAGGCPSGMTCTGTSACCTGAGCSAAQAYVCLPATASTDAAGEEKSANPSDANAADADGGGDGEIGAPSDANEPEEDAGGDAESGIPGDASDASEEDADGGFPSCTATQACVGYPSFGDWVCLELCSGLDASDCPSGMTCKVFSGCCMGTACSAVAARVCVPL